MFLASFIGYKGKRRTKRIQQGQRAPTPLLGMRVLLKETEQGTVRQRVPEGCEAPAYSAPGDLGWGGGVEWWVRRL